MSGAIDPATALPYTGITCQGINGRFSLPANSRYSVNARIPWQGLGKRRVAAFCVSEARMDEKSLARFWSKVQKTDTCWLWTASHIPSGYGQLLWDGRLQIASRVSYEIHYGPIPDGLVICHKCDNPPCVNPDHLFAGTQSDNARDKFAKGRANPTYAVGVDHGSAKLDEGDVLEILALSADGASRKELGQWYGVCGPTISKILCGKTWTHLTQIKSDDVLPPRRLSDDEVLTVVQLHRAGVGSAEIARRFGVARSGIQLIVKGRRRSGVTGIQKVQP